MHLSPAFFYTEAVIRKAIEELETGVVINGKRINNLRYADDDTTLIAYNQNECEMMLERIRVESEQAGLYLNAKKTKLMIVGTDERPAIRLKGKPIETVSRFNYLGAYIISDPAANIIDEVKRRISMRRSVQSNLRKILGSHSVSLYHKKRLV